MTLLKQNQVHEDKAVDLAEAGLTEDMARREIAVLDTRTINQNRGGMLYKACRAALQGKAWDAPTAAKPKKKRWLAPEAAPPADKPNAGEKPDVESMRQQIKGKTGGIRPRPDMLK